MTHADKSPVVRVVRVQEGNRWVEYVARITGEGVYLREKGHRKEFGPVSWGAILTKGAIMAAQEIRAAKAATGTTRAKRVRRSVLA